MQRLVKTDVLGAYFELFWARRQDSFGSYFNPTNSSPPFFQIYEDALLDILGPSASIRAIASNETFAFAHESAITNGVCFASNDDRRNE
jgi:gluconolactonase